MASGASGANASPVRFVVDASLGCMTVDVVMALAAFHF
jgi:hypothetical protein